ncbi:hypothetical protein RhiirA5_410160 [Rhizophagus irregularis]|uniref:Uncharacterized protein n=1 Tax=Rhizophagus irregularis TaxID=588596 RepID=A0A2N0Q411_9GLOM|nr:hypothetical protein RhiirA5_410160 [Rhizophagus irregularis]
MLFVNYIVDYLLVCLFKLFVRLFIRSFDHENAYSMWQLCKLMTEGIGGSHCQNLAGMTIRTIRYHRSISEDTINNPDLCYENISDIKQRNAIAKYVRIYVLKVPLPKFPPVIVALILTGNDSAKKILALYQKLIDIVADFELPIISIRSDVRLIVHIQDPKHGKKIARNAAMSGARLLTFDRQDNNAAYRVFCSKNLAQVLDGEKELSSEF